MANLSTNSLKFWTVFKKGEKIVISYGKSKENVAVMIPYAEYKGTNSIKLGVLEGKASYTFSDDFETTADELIGE